MSQTPSVGRIVHYVLPMGAAGGRNTGHIRPLIITQVWDNGMVNGKVILDGQNDLGHEDHAYSTFYSEPQEGSVLQPNTWHWPPRV